MKEKIYVTFFVVLVIGLINSTTINIFAQEIKSTGKVSPVAVDKLTKKILPVPPDLSLSPASFFSYSVDSLSQVTIQLFDENKIPLSKVIIAENTIDKSVEYKISSSEIDTEWVKIFRSSDNNKEITQAISSSGKKLRIITTTEENKGKCKTKSLISELEIFSDTALLKKMSKAELQTQEARESVKNVLMEAESTIYDTYNLGSLQRVILSLNSLHKTVVESSTPENKLTDQKTRDSLMSACTIFCVRIGTIIPIYLCNDYTYNCGCGVNGVYILSGYGCIALCAIPCSDFMY